MAHEDTWTDDLVARLRTIWPDQTKSTAAMGRELGVSKSAVVGKAHRLDLPGRPSPIGPKSAVPPRKRARRAPKTTLPPLQATQQQPEPVTAIVAPPPRQQPRPAPPPTKYKGTCQWPLGEPGTKSFRFCDDPAVLGTPYCKEHGKLAYVRVRDRREDEHAAA